MDVIVVHGYDNLPAFIHRPLGSDSADVRF
jgi:hypothetical protein